MRSVFGGYGFSILKLTFHGNAEGFQYFRYESRIRYSTPKMNLTMINEVFARLSTEHLLQNNLGRMIYP
jgi:hypothetical protein